MVVISKRVFDTDNALKGSFNGLCGRWQIITYAFFVFAYAIIVGWLNKLLDYNLLTPKNVECDYTTFLSQISHDCNVTNSTVIQQLSGKDRYLIVNRTTNQTVPFKYNYSHEYGNTVVSDFKIFCEIGYYLKAPRYSHYIGLLVGCGMLGFASDIGGRKIIILACVWTAGVMSLFQLVGHDFLSFVFFQFFLGLFVGGVQASFLPAILEMFPINFRAFYGVFFHLVICLFELLMPLLARSFKAWKLLQIFVTVPIVLTAALQYFVYESIFWYLAHKEYDKAIKVLTKLAKHNDILFESKFKQAKDFLHAKHSKATQVDILPLLRLQDVELLGKKYPQVDMTELQKQKANSSKLRRFLNSLKGESYRSTNTIYRPFDFIYSPTLLVYVIILGGLWFTNGLADSIEIRSMKEIVFKNDNKSIDFYIQKLLSNLTYVVSSLIAIGFAIFKFNRGLLVFGAYLAAECCLLGSLITEYSNPDDQTNIILAVLYYFCKCSIHFGFIFLMLLTAELFPTSLRCTGFGICFILKLLGSMIASPDLLNYNSRQIRLVYCLLTLAFGCFALFLPDTKSFPLPRSILQIEAIDTAIGKKLRSRKVQLACERRQNQYADNYNKNDGNKLDDSANAIYNQNDKGGSITYLNTDPNRQSIQMTILNSKNNNFNNNIANKDSNNQNDKQKDDHDLVDHKYDTVTSFHDIEQDDHIYYSKDPKEPLLSINFNAEKNNKLGKILEVPSKNITRNNSVADALDTDLKV